MPPKAASRKRPLQEANSNAPPSKRQSTGKLAGAPASDSKLPEVYTLSRRVPEGPNGEPLLPYVIPFDFVKHLKPHLSPFPSSVVGMDGSEPKNSATLGDRRWWEINAKYLLLNQKKFKIKPEHWKQGFDLLSQEPDPSEIVEGDLDWVCISKVKTRGSKEYYEEEEDDDDDDDDDDENEKVQEKSKADIETQAKTPKEGELASDHPEHDWVMTRTGLERFRWWVQEINNRDQDNFMMYVYNHFSHYGCAEVMENMWSLFNEVSAKKDVPYLKVWAEIEGLALVLACGYDEWQCSDGADKVTEMVEVIGVMTLTAIDRLIEEKVFGPDSPVKNLSNMLGLIVDWNELVNEGMMDSFTESSSWVRRVVELAETHGVPITYPEGVEKYIKKVKEAGDAPKKWKTMTWKKKYTQFKKKHVGSSRGASTMDITQWSIAERKKYCY